MSTESSVGRQQAHVALISQILAATAQSSSSDSTSALQGFGEELALTLAEVLEDIDVILSQVIALSAENAELRRLSSHPHSQCAQCVDVTSLTDTSLRNQMLEKEMEALKKESFVDRSKVWECVKMLQEASAVLETEAAPVGGHSIICRDHNESSLSMSKNYNLGNAQLLNLNAVEALEIEAGRMIEWAWFIGNRGKVLERELDRYVSSPSCNKVSDHMFLNAKPFSAGSVSRHDALSVLKKKLIEARDHV